MIISHEHQFFFLKPGKVAGSAVEISLERKLSKDAIVTPINRYDASCDESQYISIGRNSVGYCEHMTPAEIKKILPTAWEEYTKITISRNPLDMLISRWHWEGWLLQKYGKPGLHSYISMFNKFIRTGNISINQVYRKLKINQSRKMIARTYPNGDFASFIRLLPDVWTNDQYYFDGNKLIPDIVLRYEQLQEDFDCFCQKYGLQTNKLPKVKSKLRPGKSISDYFSPDLSILVAERFQKQIYYFNYGSYFKKLF